MGVTLTRRERIATERVLEKMRDEPPPWIVVRVRRCVYCGRALNRYARRDLLTCSYCRDIPDQWEAAR